MNTPTSAIQNDGSIIQELATFSTIDYEQRRKQVADQLGIRVSKLDEVVEQERTRISSANKSGTMFNEPAPWPSIVDGSDLLDELLGAFNEHLVLQNGAADALALWVMHTHSHDASFISPILGVLSPDKRCGKSTLLSLLEALVSCPLTASNITPAALFRTIDMYYPTTLLIDEADTFLKSSDELRGILNSGHKRDTARVIRTTGENFEPTIFSTWGPKVIAMIGQLPSTLTDRAVIVDMKRKRRDEKVKRLRLDKMATFVVAKRKAIRWASDHMAELRCADPSTPVGFNDRAVDNWRPLLAIADLAGGEWPDRARQAMHQLNLNKDDDAAGIMLLQDIYNIFAEKKAHSLRSSYIVDDLEKMEERPWPEWSRRKPITARQVAKLLMPFDISPKNLRDGYSVHKGYELTQLVDAFSRYLPDYVPIKFDEVVVKPKTVPNADCSGVAAGSPKDNKHIVNPETRALLDKMLGVCAESSQQPDNSESLQKQ